MKFTKTALATAIGATIAMSGVAQADGHKGVSVYGRINTAINMVDDDDGVAGTPDEDSTNISNIVSRFGVKASADMGGGMTAHGRYEWSVSSDDEGGVGDGRIAEVGVTGENFGTVKVGNMWSTYYNMVGTHLDPTVTLGAVLYSSVADLPYRTSNTIQYSNSFGAVSVSAELRMVDEDDPDDNNTATGNNVEKIGESDGNAIGVSFMVMDNLTLAAVVDSQDGVGTAGDEDRTGFAAKWSQDNWWVSFGTGETDIDGGDTTTQTQFHAGLDLGDGLSGFIGVGSVETDAASGPDPEDADATTFNITKKFGGSGFRVYWEGIMAEAGDAELTQHVFGARIDF